MNRALIANWQAQVGHDDDVYIIGDVFFTSTAEAIRILDQLPGRKHLIFGNHDENIRKSPELLAKFESVHEYLVLTIDEIIVVLFHFPILEWHRMHYGSYHLYGHVHGKTQVPGRAMDVGVDSRRDNKLWEWSEVHAKLKDGHVRSHH